MDETDSSFRNFEMMMMICGKKNAHDEKGGEKIIVYEVRDNCSW